MLTETITETQSVPTWELGERGSRSSVGPAESPFPPPPPRPQFPRLSFRTGGVLKTLSVLKMHKYGPLCFSCITSKNLREDENSLLTTGDGLPVSRGQVTRIQAAGELSVVKSALEEDTCPGAAGYERSQFSGAPTYIRTWFPPCRAVVTNARGTGK